MQETITSLERLTELIPTWLGRDYAVDTETDGLDHYTNKLLGISLTFGDNEDSYYIVFEHNLEDWQGNPILVELIDRRKGMDVLRALFAQPHVIVAAHNAKFEMHQFANWDVWIEGRLYDTLLAAQLLDENRRNGLKELAPLVGMKYDKYQDRVRYKGYDRNAILGAPLAEVADYAMSDTLATWRLYKKFKDEMAGLPFERTFYDVWMPMLFTIFDMERAGITVDREKAKELLAEHTVITEQYEQDVRIEGLKMLASMKPDEIPDLYLTMMTPEQMSAMYEADDGYLRIDIDGVALPVVTHDMKGKTARWTPRVPQFKVSSDKQKIDLLFNHLHLDKVDLPFPLKTTNSGEISTDKDNIQTLIFAHQPPPPVLTSLQEWGKSEKFVNTYLRTLIERPDKQGRIHASFNQAVSDAGTGGTATGRLSSADPNLQNQPSQGEVGKQCRSLFIAGEGMTLLVSDYENLELRILGHYSQDETIVKAFAEGLDLHSLTASNQNDIDYQTFVDEVANGNEDFKAMRRVGKVSNFGLAYGMGPIKFQRYLLVNADTHVTVEQAAQLIAGYNETYKGSMEWKQRVYKWAHQLGYVKTLAGRYRRLPELNSRVRYEVMRAERQAVNAIIQGSAADVIMEAMPPLHRALRAVGGRILLQVHDEIVAEVPKDVADIGIKIMDSLMVDLANKKLRVPLAAHAHAAENWYLAKGA